MGKTIRVLQVIMLLLLMTFSFVIAADGVSTEKGADLSQILAGTFAFLFGGSGLILVNSIKVISELHEAVNAITAVPPTIKQFTAAAPEELKKIPEYRTMVEAIDKSFEELADLMEMSKATKKYSAALRESIKQTAYTT